MTCPKCGLIIPDSMAFCPACVQRQNDAAMFAMQAQLLPAVVAGQADLATAVRSKVRHIRMFNTETTFCGELIERGSKRGHLSWFNLDRTPDVCPGCRSRVKIAAGLEETVPAK